MKHIRIAGLAAAALLVAAGCGKKEEAAGSRANETAVEVNGAKLTVGEVDSEADARLAGQNGTPEQKAQMRKTLRGQIVKTFILKTVLLEKAKELGIAVSDEDYAARAQDILKANARGKDAPKTIEEFCAKSPVGKARALQEFRDGVVIDKLIKAAVIDTVKVTDEEVDKHIAAVEKQLADAKAANAEADEKALAKITELKKQLDAGADFAELAKANSECPSKDKGGALGTFTRGQMVKEFEDVAFSIEPGKVSDPVKTRYGYHLIRVDARAATGPDKVESVTASHILAKGGMRRTEPQVPAREQAEAQIRQMNGSRAVRGYFDSLCAAAKIVAAEEFKEFVPKAPAPAPAGDKAEAGAEAGK